MMVNYEVNFYGGKFMDIWSIILIVGALLVIPLMYAVRQIFIEGK